jgi:hypothetical protein
VNRRFGGTSVHTISTRRHIPEDGILHSHRREKLKSYIPLAVLFSWFTQNKFLELLSSFVIALYNFSLSTTLQQAFLPLFLGVGCVMGQWNPDALPGIQDEK